jgi:hypothetical protein
MSYELAGGNRYQLIVVWATYELDNPVRYLRTATVARRWLSTVHGRQLRENGYLDLQGVTRKQVAKLDT